MHIRPIQSDHTVQEVFPKPVLPHDPSRFAAAHARLPTRDRQRVSVDLIDPRHLIEVGRELDGTSSY
jgi:hypothetical protein